MARYGLGPVDEETRRMTRRRNLRVGLISGLVGLLVAGGAVTAVSAFTGNDHKPDFSLHFEAGDEDGATTTTDADTGGLLPGPTPST